jgi:hypothetical protein
MIEIDVSAGGEVTVIDGSHPEVTSPVTTEQLELVRDTLMAADVALQAAFTGADDGIQADVDAVAAAVDILKFVDLNDCPSSLTGKGYFYPIVNSGATALEFAPDSAFVLGQPGLTTLASVITAVGANPRALVIPHRSATVSIAADTTVPSNLTVTLMRGPSIDVASGKTLTFQGQFIAGPYQVFTGTGSVVFTGVNVIYDVWFPTPPATPAAITAGIGSLFIKTSGASCLWYKDSTGWVQVKCADYALTTALADYVALTGNQTVAGIKTFSSFPVTPSSAPTSDYQVANKQYVDKPVVILEHRANSGTAGGGQNSGSWDKRTLNREVVDTGSICSLSSNEFTLPAGTYDIEARFHFYNVGTYAGMVLSNITDSVNQQDVASGDITGMARYGTTSSDMSPVHFMSRFTLSGSKALAFKSIIQSSNTTDGWGRALSLGPEIYAQVKIVKVA